MIHHGERSGFDVAQDFGDGDAGGVGNLHRIGVGVAAQVLTNDLVFVPVAIVANPANILMSRLDIPAFLTNFAHILTPYTIEWISFYITRFPVHGKPIVYPPGLNNTPPTRR
jgi:hypothetical protein